MARNLPPRRNCFDGLVAGDLVKLSQGIHPPVALQTFTGDNKAYNIREVRVGLFGQGDLGVVLDPNGPDHNRFLVKILAPSGVSGWIHKNYLSRIGDDPNYRAVQS